MTALVLALMFLALALYARRVHRVEGHSRGDVIDVAFRRDEIEHGERAA